MKEKQLILKTLYMMLHHLKLKRSIIYRFINRWELSMFDGGLCGLTRNCTNIILPALNSGSIVWENKSRFEQRFFLRTTIMQLLYDKSSKYNRKGEYGYWWKQGRTKERIQTVQAVIDDINKDIIKLPILKV